CRTDAWAVRVIRVGEVPGSNPGAPIFQAKCEVAPDRTQTNAVSAEATRGRLFGRGAGASRERDLQPGFVWLRPIQCPNPASAAPRSIGKPARGRPYDRCSSRRKARLSGVLREASLPDPSNREGAARRALAGVPL